MSAHRPVAGTGQDQARDEQVGEGFGFLLMRHRRDAGLTQEELAARSGLSVRAIRDLERGRARSPQRESVRALIMALGLVGREAAAFARAARAGRGARTGETPPSISELCELPSGVADFTGRSEELDRLRALADLVGPAQARSTGTVVISAILGQAGIGKTALALRMGHELESRFPDVRLYVDLRGTGERPADPAEVLGRFLAALGLPQRLIPVGLEERAARYRALLFKREALVVLDNAADEAQVRPLLPGSPRSLVLVTSRNVLAGLETPHRLLLDVLTPEDAVTMLTEIVGKRALAEPDATAEVAELCGFLPLALRIAGNRLASRPAWSVAFLADRLRGEQARLQVLQAGDLQVRAAFALSYGQASPAAQRLFRLLSLVPGSDFGTGLAAVLGETDSPAADAVLEELADASLILPAEVSGRYRFHDLMRLFAGEKLAEETDHAASQAIRERMVDWLLKTAVRAGRCFFPPDDELGAEPERRAATQAAAAGWLETERSNWAGALRWSVENPRPGKSMRLSDIGWFLNWYHNVGGRWDDWRELCEFVAVTLRGSGRPAEVVFLVCLVDALLRMGRWQEALRNAEEAQAAARKLGRRRHYAWALEMAARVHRSDQVEKSVEYELEALAIFKATGSEIEQAVVLDGLGLTLGTAGRFEEAVRYHRQAVDIARQWSDKALLAVALVSFGETLIAMGEFEDAVDCLQQAVAIHVSRGGDAWREGVALRGLGLALQELGRLGEAADVLRRAAARFAETGDRYDRAGVLEALGAVLRELGEADQATGRWRESLAIYEQLDMPEAGKVRRLLAGKQ